MKVLIIGTFPEPITGMSMANYTLYRGLLEKKIEVDYIDTKLENSLTNKEKQGKFDCQKIVKVLKKMLKEIKRVIKNKDEIVCISVGTTFLGFLRYSHYMLFSFLKGKKVFLHFHTSTFRRMYNNQNIVGKKILKFFLYNSKGLIVLGESLVSLFDDIVDKNKIYICENGVQNEIVATEEEIAKKREKLGNDTKKRVLYLSNLMKEKGILDLLKASEKFDDNEIEFNLAGEIEPNIKEEVESYLKKYPKKIKYHGIVKGKEKKKLLLENYIFILPSYDEGQPISILEAYATGCSVITDELVGGIGDIFENCKNGLSVKSKNIDSICECIKDVKVEEYIKKNYELIEKKFSEKKFVERLLNIFLKGVE